MPYNSSAASNCSSKHLEKGLASTAFILRRNRDNVNIASSAAETLEIANLGFAALADEIHHRIALSGVSRLAADLFYSAHAAFPPMNGIAP